MKHIVILVGSYYPNFSAVGVCAHNIVEELKKNNTLTVICEATCYGEKKQEKLDGYPIYKILSPLQKLFLLSKKFQTSSFFLKRWLGNIMTFVIRSFRYLQAFIQTINIKKDIVKEYLKTIEEVNAKQPIDTIVSFVFPFETCVAGMKFKQKNKQTILIPFLMDRFAASSSLHRTVANQKRKFNKHVHLEKEVFLVSDKIIHLESWQSHIHRFFPDLLYKFILSEHPLLVPFTSKVPLNYNNRQVHIVYTGVLIKSIRNPEYAIQTFSNILRENTNIVLHFYTRGDCETLLNTFAQQFPHQVINHGAVNLDHAHAAMLQADILLSVGNQDITQTASKIFEYIATGKPIIHFTKDVKDPVNSILSPYNSALIISENNSLIKDAVYQLKDFIQKKHTIISWKEIEEKYITATPLYSSNIINDFQ